MIFDVAVLGAGVSGSSAALMLAREGLRVALLGAPPHPSIIDYAETLSSAARPWLDHLGVWQDFQQIGCLPLLFSESIWGYKNHQKFSMLSPYGPDWIIPKFKFVSLLQNHAKLHGAKVFWCRWDSIHRTRLKTGKDLYRINLGDLCNSLYAHTVIDASGHRANIARQLGSKRSCTSHQAAYIWQLPATKTLEPWSTTHSHPSGWVYAATNALSGYSISHYIEPRNIHKLKQEVFETDKPNCHSFQIPPIEVLSPLEDKIGITNLKNKLTRLTPIIRSATSSNTWPVADSSWVAVGDAACTLDPLSSTGLLHALRSACKGAQALLSAINGNEIALKQYSSMTQEFFIQYLAERKQIYTKTQN